MRMFDVIRAKRDGETLTKKQIDFFIKGYCSGEIPDYQASALVMAIYLNGMNAEETADLTMAVRDSGKRLKFENIKGVRVDKHSTGGVGDKTSLVVAPAVASLGLKVAKMSGRGLGHTGGTIDKLESIPGFKTDLTADEFQKIVNETGLAIAGQTGELAPADKKLYALRDVTATIDSIPLIASSIMGKKLAADDDCIVLDVKTGSGSFMKTEKDAKKLAEVMVDIGKRAGKKMLALITDMDTPLGYAIGNSLEVIEAVDVLKGQGPLDLTEICVELAASMLQLAEYGDMEQCREKVKETLKNGNALKTFTNMVKAQGGDAACILNTGLFKKARFCHEVKAEESGYIAGVDAEGYGTASLLLGAGRNKKEDEIDPSAGILLKAKTGDHVSKGETIAILFSDKKESFSAAGEKIISSTLITPAKPKRRPLILSRVE